MMPPTSLFPSGKGRRATAPALGVTGAQKARGTSEMLWKQERQGVPFVMKKAECFSFFQPA